MWLCSCLVCPPDRIVDSWARQIKYSLQHDDLFESPELVRVLLDESEDDFDENTDEAEESDLNDWIVQGVPRRPLYKEFAYRLVHWNRQVYSSSESLLSEEPRFMVEAECLGFREIKQRSLESPPKHHQETRNWMRQVGSWGILRILGIRDTIGSANITTIPCRTALLAASREIHHPNSLLTVAARARTKHAHRGKENFFGVAKGTPPVQNQQTEEILVRLLEKIVWMNMHSFGGLNDDDFAFEIRVREGYGARWLVHSAGKSLRFRGFLEPQMKDGHEQRWRH
jgi:hypothetical protein